MRLSHRLGQIRDACAMLARGGCSAGGPGGDAAAMPVAAGRARADEPATRKEAAKASAADRDGPDAKAAGTRAARRRSSPTGRPSWKGRCWPCSPPRGHHVGRCRRWRSSA